MPRDVELCPQESAVILARMAAEALEDGLTVETLLLAGCTEEECRAALRCFTVN